MDYEAESDEAALLIADEAFEAAHSTSSWVPAGEVYELDVEVEPNTSSVLNLDEVKPVLRTARTG